MLLVCRQEFKMARCPKPPIIKFKMKIKKFCPGWCGSVDGVTAREPKGHWFSSQSGHEPGLQAGSPVGGVHGNQSMYPLHTAVYLSFSLPFPLSKEKNFFIVLLIKKSTLT